MSRPADWHVLDLAQDPVPGDPATVRELARSARRTADDALVVVRDVQALARDRAVLSWVGAAADVFSVTIGAFPGKLERVGTSYALADTALHQWAETLDGAQRVADG